MDNRTRSKPHINAVSRELHFIPGKTRSLSNAGGSLVNSIKFGAASAHNDDNETGDRVHSVNRSVNRNQSSFMNRSQRSGLMPSASQPTNLQALGSQIDDLSIYKKMLQDQEQKLAE